jgi:hypothetical protein
MLVALPIVLLILIGLLWRLASRDRWPDAAPPGWRVLTSDLRGRGVVLRDVEWGLVGKIDLLLEGPGGALVPVEYKRAWKGYESGTTRASHLVQVAVYFILCEGDPRIRRQPAEGWIRYVDERGQVVPGGEVRIRNTPEARQQVIAIAQLVRQAKVTGGEVHRTHNSRYNCRGCFDRGRCGEAKRG